VLRVAKEEFRFFSCVSAIFSAPHCIIRDEKHNHFVVLQNLVQKSVCYVRGRSFTFPFWTERVFVGFGPVDHVKDFGDVEVNL
jgi:hypothetical protein